MGIFFSRPPCPTDETAIVASSQRRPTCGLPQLDLPADVFTCILDFMVEMNPQTMNDKDISTLVSFRLVNQSTKLAFDKMNAWRLIYSAVKQQVDLLTHKICILSSTIADPPSLTCILKFDAYLTQCWTLKNDYSLKRNVLQEVVLARLENKLGGNDHNKHSHYNNKQQLILISEWIGDECTLKFEPIGNEELHGFALPAIDQSELPFVVA